MTTLKPFDNLLAIEVPIDAENIKISNRDTENLFYEQIGYLGIVNIKIVPKGFYKFLGCVTPTEIDFDVACLYGITPKDFRSLLSYNGIEIKEGHKLVILEKV